MPRKMAGIFGASNIFWMVFAVSQAFKIEIFPEDKIIAQIGDSVSLTCSTTGCEAPSFSWRTQMDSPLNGKVKNEGSKSILTMDPVSFGNEHSYLCTATCESKKLEKEIQVEIYSFPKDPEITLSGPLEVGQPVTIICSVAGVYPFDRLEMSLMKGKELMKGQEFLEEMESKILETKSLEVTFTPRKEDIGKYLVCHAKLHIDGIGTELRERETRKKLQLYASPKNIIRVVKPPGKLQEGDSVTMTCISEGLPAPQIIWSKKLDNGDVQVLSGNASLTLLALRVEDSGIYICEEINSHGEHKEEVELIVQAQAFKIEIFPEDKIIAQIGDSVSLTCSTTGCEAPSFSWRTQMDSPLNGKVKNEGSKSILTMDPVSFGNEHSYLCTATCESKKLEKEIQVEIYSFPKDPEITLSGPLEVGQPVTIICSVAGVYPFDRLEMSLMKGKELMKGQEFLEEMESKILETKSLEVTFTPRKEDIGKYLVCHAKLHIDGIGTELRERETRKKLQLYASPKNIIRVVKPPGKLQEGDSVTMTCISEGLPAPQIIWSKKLDNGDVQVLSGNASLTLIALRVEDSGIYICEEINSHGEHKEEVELIVQEKPFSVEISPGPQIAAQIGDSVMLTCEATGCETPTFSWKTQMDSPLVGSVKSEKTKSTLILNPVSFEHEHFYLCTVTCGHKKLEKGIQVNLYSFPRDPEIELNNLPVTGHPLTVSCKVENVYPLDRLELQLLKGERIMKNKNFLEDVEKKSLETRSLDVSFIPSIEDTGKILVCLAKLHIDEMEFEPKQRQSIKTLSFNVPPKDIQLTAFPSETVKEGDTVIISCTCENIPKTWIILKKKAETGDTVLKSTDGAYTIHKAQLRDAGVYECESKNEVGLQLRSLTLDVKGKGNKDYFSPELLVLYCASSLIIPAIGMIIYFARKANMKGSYSLVEAQKSKV